MAYEDDFNIQDGIAYSKLDTYAHCDRCGFRPVVNRKCISCDVTPGEASQRLADLLRRFCTGRGGFHADLAARIIQACVTGSGIEVLQATNQDYE